MKVKNIIVVMSCLLAACGFSACSESDNTWNPYYDWQARNARWFEQVADTARKAIAQAKAEYGGKEWENHCDWRMFKTLQKSQNVNTGKLADSICVRIIQRGKGTICPMYNDTVRLNFRGWIMETEYDDGDGKLFPERRVFTQSYYGDFNPETAAPSVSPVRDMIEGFQTALQYMREGDDWLVYIPQELAYEGKNQADIPAFSTLLFRVNMVVVYPAGTGVPAWKVRQK